tara:strand:- start:4912 stop:7476 length:2565 start_codon:yes stop_codon:yes gene_type:complete
MEYQYIIEKALNCWKNNIHFNYSMKKYCIFILALLLVSCFNDRDINDVDITKAIPKNSDLIIKYHDPFKIYSKINEFPWWSQLKAIGFLSDNLKIIKQINSTYNIAELFYGKNVYLSSVIIGENMNNILLITNISNLEIKENKLAQTINSNKNNAKKYDGVIINNIKIGDNKEDKKDLFFSIHNNIFLLSFSKIIIEESIRQINTESSLLDLNPIKKLNTNLPKYSDLNVLVKTQFLEKLIGQKNIFLNSNTWSCFDLELNEDNIIFNGVTNRGKIKYLKNNQYSDTQNSDIEAILPRHIKGFYKYQINNESDLNEVINIITDGAHKNIYHLSYKDWSPSEINVAYTDPVFMKKSHIIFKPDKNNMCLQYLKKHQINEKEKYLKYDIYEITRKNMPKGDWLNELLLKWNNIYYTSIGNYFIFCENKQNIKALINNKISKQTIGGSKALKIMSQKLGSKSHTSFYLNFQNHKQEWKKVFNSILSKNIASKDYFFNSIILLHENTTIQNPTAWTLNLNNETTYQPQFVLNHYNNELEIMTQDVENIIYLIDNRGDILWKKQLNNTIISKIHQIDRYKNNKLQYLFNTKDAIHLIDRNGKNVSPFPIKTNNEMSIPLGLFDYDENKNYRILSIMNNQVAMYDDNGQIISGWQFTNANSNIQNTPEHYQISNKDYIVISEENGTTHLLNRKGQQRVVVKDKIYRSDNGFNLIYNNSKETSKLITLDNNKNVICLNFNGVVDTLNHNLSSEDQYVKNDNQVVIIKENKLFYSSKKNTFEFKFKTKPESLPKLFYNNDSIIISVKHKNENLIYLINENGQLYTTPFFGTTDYSISKDSKSGKLNLITGSKEGVIYNYKIN